MTALHVAGVVLQALGVAAVIGSALALLRAPSVASRLHALAPATSLGAPVLAVGTALRMGGVAAPLTALAIGALVALTGPAVTIATARAAAK